MKTNLDHYKYIDKSTHFIFNEKDTFKVLHLTNFLDSNAFYVMPLKSSYIQLYFCNLNACKIAFNAPHCAVNCEANRSSLVYFKEPEMNVLFELPPNSEVFAILISVEYFHALFSLENNYLYNFSNFKLGKPIIEPKDTNASIRLILNQIATSQLPNQLRAIFIKGKVYELMSYYFSANTTANAENCPYIANEEVLLKIKRAKEIIIKEMNNPPSLEELAKEVGLNIKKLKTEFKEIYGVPVFTFLLNYKMELAKTLLQENQLNVNEIANNLGYSTSSHFIAAFKRKYGITPKQFAKT